MKEVQKTKKSNLINHPIFIFLLGICRIYSSPFRGESMKEQLHLKNHLKEVRMAASFLRHSLQKWWVCRETLSVLSKQGNSTHNSKVSFILCIALDKKFEELFYF